jgi:hypothetical protein
MGSPRAARKIAAARGSGIDDGLTPDQPAHEQAAIVAEPPIPAPRARASGWDWLNPADLRHTSTVAFGLLDSRLTNEGSASRGYAISGGEGMALLSGAFSAGGLHEQELRFVPNDALSLGLSRYQLEAGLRLGPLEPMARVGFTTLHLDIGHGFSLGLFSPRVGAGLWLALGKARLGASAFAEYYWRWLGDDSALVHGLSIELQLETPLPGARATSSPSPSPRGRR